MYTHSNFKIVVLEKEIYEHTGQTYVIPSLCFNDKIINFVQNHHYVTLMGDLKTQWSENKLEPKP